jgi:hypothetical protein
VKALVEAGYFTVIGMKKIIHIIAKEGKHWPSNFNLPLSSIRLLLHGLTR